MKTNELPFIYGAQYYRAPTPEPEFWKQDFENMRKIGFNTVKFWVQWRWSERKHGVYYWDDLDQLMDIAQQYDMKVILNLILDVMPVWVPKEFPDALMVDYSGHQVPVTATGCRQIGGYPGPCYNHPQTTEIRKQFFAAAIQHFKGHPALFSWDVWNEPEHHLGMRSAENPEHQLCYCENCRTKFIAAMQKKYQTIEHLNDVWGRCYSAFDELELPKDRTTFNDFIDWREFQLDTLTHDAEWRLDLVHQLDPETPAHLHTVPDTAKCFHALNCVDDFALAAKCDFFGATTMADRTMICQSVSAAPGKPVYNAEWHINFGNTGMHQRVISRNMFLKEALPQFGWGLRGILYWQYHAERLGLESPAWGLVRADGSPRPVTKFAEDLIQKLSPYLNEYQSCRPELPCAAILRDRKNELFQYCMSGSFENFWKSLYAYSDVLYKKSIPYSFVSSGMLEKGLPENIRLLIVPCAYYLTNTEAKALTRFAENGGTLLIEGIPGGYSADEGRHAASMPGCGLAEAWDLHIMESVSTFHLDCRENEPSATNAAGDVAKALDSVGVKGGKFIPIKMNESEISGFGSIEFVQFEGGCWKSLANYRGMTCIAEKEIGKGKVIYAGSMLGTGVEKTDQLLQALIDRCCGESSLPYGLHVSNLVSEDREVLFSIVENTTEKTLDFTLPEGEWVNIFEGRLHRNCVQIEPGTARIFKR